ncbi:hypothetical protein G6F56_014642 [Rhizopus delemar]|uniref:Uncharacterized protein n=1 Tax=Rhizopus delemar TaxID=936053 RepID=A0A9P7CFL1_9FUNG|nr:hypothetical protein G6F22_021790 [Rhizopus arrhizus]KAG1433168.1 hypothetical protein G6F56_014642 [Rhizopus delemar]KAG1551927.1 hypothetical protein G6F50_013142 [Rhizopus delemar]
MSCVSGAGPPEDQGLGAGAVPFAAGAGAASPRILAAISEAAWADATPNASTPRFSGSAMLGAATSS